MPLGGILIAIFIGFVLDKEVSRKALIPYMGEKYFKAWLFIMRFVAPISIFAIMLNELGIFK